ncbi:MAG: hypothetical protein JJT90_02740 [Ectothiorhodospiraceae bacterium]|nr:hypothetical protein [Ectothiorhodospiraceae bacterium]
MRGVVKHINEEFGLVAVETEHGEYTVFGLMDGGVVNHGDVIVGDLEQLDHQALRNETSGVEIHVYIEDTELSLDDARAKLS